jgi:NAD(P)-dependent dehydrogenase (short-subunit alcohol dehydrogenase family)
VANAFMPALRSSRGTLLNVLSVLSWLGTGDTYSATKAALWSATNTMRLKLAPDGVHVAALHLGYADTPMTRRIDAPKLDAADVVRTAYDGLEAGDFEILADDLSRQVKAGLAGPIKDLYPQLAEVRP